MQRGCESNAYQPLTASVDVQAEVDALTVARDALACLDGWLSRNGITGYDPYDVRGTRLFLALTRLDRSSPLPLRAARRLLFRMEQSHPLLVRRLLRVRPAINAKGVGLLARAYVLLYRVSGDDAHRRRAVELLEWLRTNASPGYHGLAWGYPFDWQSKVLIPRGVPSAVVSSVVGDAFWEAYWTFGDHAHLEACQSICAFMMQDLNVDEIDAETVCFSYTPVDDFHVHNANLFVAEFLTRVGAVVGDPAMLDLGLRAAQYALSEQNEDGSLYYWGRIQNHYNPNHIDHYHSGFEIRALHGLWKNTGDHRFLEAARRYYNFYRRHLIEWQDGRPVPKHTPTSRYPTDIHSCAEAILCNAYVAADFPEAREILDGVVPWIIERMQTAEGFFLYRLEEKRGRERVIRIPYIRWGQAWMMLALAAYMHVKEFGHRDAGALVGRRDRTA